MYSTESLAIPYYYFAKLMSRIFGQPDTKCLVEWVPLMGEVADSYVMDWGNILSNNISNQIFEYRKNCSISSKNFPSFYMSAYIIDVVCFTSDFLAMGCKWTTQDHLLIHVYYNMLWVSKFENHFYKIFHGVILPLFQPLFNEKAPRLSKEAQADFSSIGKWFGEELFTYVRVFGSLSRLHVLPLYVHDKILTREVAYQSVGNELTRLLKEDKKASWPSFPIYCGVYCLDN